MYYINIFLLLMIFRGLISRAPDVRKSNRRVKSVEDAEGQGDVAEDGPDRDGVEHDLLLVNITLEKNGVHDVDGQIGHEQKHQGVPASFSLLESNRV